MKPSYLILAAAIAFAATLPAQQAAPQPKIVAIINGEVLTVDQFNAMWDRLSPDMRKSYEMSGGKAQFLDWYIGKRLVVQQALKENYDKRKEVALDLEAQRESWLFDRYIREVVAAEVLTEEELRKYYEANKAQFRRPERVKMRQIAVTPYAQPVYNTANDDARTPEEAEAKIKRLAMQATPKNFAELALKFSEDAAARSGGDLGWMSRDNLIDGLSAAAFALQPGQISKPVVAGEEGIQFLLYVEDRKPAGFAEFAEVRREILERLVPEKSADILSRVTRLSRDLRGDSKISVFSENF